MWFYAIFLTTICSLNTDQLDARGAVASMIMKHQAKVSILLVRLRVYVCVCMGLLNDVCPAV